MVGLPARRRVAGAARALRGAFGGIRLRLTLSFLAVVTVLFVGAAWGVQASFRSVLDDQLESEAAAAADVVAQQLSVEGELGVVPWRPTARLEYFVRSPTLVRSGLLGADDRYVDAEVPAVGPAGTGYEVERSGGSVSVTRSVPSDPSATVTIYATGSGGTAVDSALTEVGVPVLGLLAVAVVVVVWVTVGLVLAPVERIRAAAEEIGRGDNDMQQVPVPDGDDELRRLAVTLNEMLTSLEAASERQREFISDASHELRTPIATLRTLAATESPDIGAWRAAVGAAAVRLDRLVEDLFTLARLDEFGLPSVGDVDLDAVCEQAVHTVRAVADAHGVSVSCELVPVRLVGNAAMLERAVVNLVANAVRYADSQVVVSCGGTGATAWLAVDDDGPGIPEDKREQVFERFTRLESGRERAAGGAGLGLAIVAGAVDAHGGRVRSGTSLLGGARFKAELPVDGPGS